MLSVSDVRNKLKEAGYDATFVDNMPDNIVMSKGLHILIKKGYVPADAVDRTEVKASAADHYALPSLYKSLQELARVVSVQLTPPPEGINIAYLSDMGERVHAAAIALIQQHEAKSKRATYFSGPEYDIGQRVEILPAPHAPIGNDGVVGDIVAWYATATATDVGMGVSISESSYKFDVRVEWPEKREGEIIYGLDESRIVPKLDFWYNQ